MNSLADYLQKKFNFDAHYFIKGGLWLSISQVFLLLSGLLTTVVFVRLLNPTDFGIYRYLISLASIFSVFSLIGLGQSVLQATARGFLNFYNESLLLNIKFSSLVSISALLTAAYYLFNSNLVLAAGCLLIAILQPLIVSFGNVQFYLQGSSQYKKSTLANAGKTLFITLSSLLTVLLTQNILILVFVFLFTSTVSNIVLHIIFRPSTLETTPPDIQKNFKYHAGHISLRNCFLYLANRTDMLIVFSLLGAPALALYTIATIIPEQMKGILKNLSTLLLPKYSQSENMELLKRSIPKRSWELFLLLVGVMLLYMICATPIYTILFPEYPDAIALTIFSALSFPAFIFFIPNSFLQAQKKEANLYKIALINSIFQIAVSIYFIANFAIIGAIAAKVISRYILMLTSYYYYSK